MPLQVKNHIIPDSERQPCEVWSRVMGYYRPIENFNIGKKGEHNERVFFSEEVAMISVAAKNDAAKK